MRAFQREKVPAVDVLQPNVGEELVKPVGPDGREKRVVVGPQHRGRHRDSLRWLRRPLGRYSGEPAHADAVPADRRGERARLGVYRDEVVEVVIGEGESGSGPVRPEMAQVMAHGVRPAVDEFVGDRKLVKGQVPELLLRCWGKDPLADARQRWGKYQRPEQVRALWATA